MTLPDRLSVLEIAEVHAAAQAASVIDASRVTRIDACGAQLLAWWILQGKRIEGCSDVVEQAVARLGLAPGWGGGGTVSSDDLRRAFLVECADHIDTIEAGLLAMANGALDTETLSALFRGAHSIKGGCGTFGLDPLARFVHAFESVLAALRDQDIEGSPELLEVFLESLDLVRQGLDRARGGDVTMPPSTHPLTRRLEAMLPANSQTAGQPDLAEAWQIELTPRLGALLHQAPILEALEALEDLGDVYIDANTRALAATPFFDPTVCYLTWRVTLMGRIRYDDVERTLAPIASDVELEVTVLMEVWEEDPVVATAPPPTPAARPEAPPAPQTIRVELGKIDVLINLIGELVITQNMLREATGDQGSPELRNGLETLERNTRQLQEGVLGLRMLRMGTLFDRAPRLIHDLQGKLGKQLRLEIGGAETELDKRTLEKLADPLTHLIRNCADHGIEAAERRIAVGKDPVGTIRLDAAQQGSFVVVRIADDGGGLDLARIVDLALERGIIEPDEPLTDPQKAELILLPGFSTAEVVSDTSGRGVGMDVVRGNVEQLGGSITIDTTADLGSCFTIRVPLTLSIMDGQLIGVGDELFVLPLLSIVRTLRITDDQIQRLPSGQEILKQGQGALSVIRLGDLLDSEPASTDLLVVVVESARGQVAVLVEELLGQQQVVIKSIEENYQRVPGISGATILGDGRVALILDMNDLARMAERTAHRLDRRSPRRSGVPAPSIAL